MPDRVLYAEDNPALASVVRFNLEKGGLQVTVTANGREAWEYAQNELFDIVICDHKMPQMTGVELCQRLRADPRYRQAPIVLLTGKRYEISNEDELPFTRVLSKPFSPRALLELVQTLLSS